ncbi:bifunctional diguanylate cyclase/phosphodiesterase [Agrobacterium cavarae]
MLDEHARISALKNMRLLDTMPSENFDRITRLVANYFGLPIAAISLTDTDRQWFKSKVGVDHNEIPRHKAPCSHVAEHKRPVVVNDLQKDDYYADSTLGRAGIRFYCGVPLVTPDGHGLGALCVLGIEPFEVTDEQMATLSDLAAMVMDQIELHHSMGRIDPSSGLPNRHQLMSDLSDLALHEKGSEQIISLIDLAQTTQFDRMMRVVGISYLDGLMTKVARILREHLDGGTFAYHIGPTQFAFIVSRGTKVEDYRPFLEQIMRALYNEVEFQITMTPSIGSMVFRPGETSAEEILRSLQSAVQDARIHPSKIAFFCPSLDVQHQRNFMIQREFPRAIIDDAQLSLVFQPRVDAASGLFKSAEVLLRWTHPELGPISPAEFIPVIEASAYARELTMWVIATSLQQLSEWNSTGFPIKVSINLSATNLQEADFWDRLSVDLARFGVDHDQVEFEITETAMMMETKGSQDLLETLAASGIQLSIDDFGTGYSSLSYLQKLPVKTVKIDRSFINDMQEGNRERVLVQSMITLCHSLGYEVVAEGVETREQAELLTVMGCDELQGYWLSKPIAPDALIRWMSERHAAQHYRLEAISA